MCASNTSPTRAVHETILVIEDELRSQRLLRLNLEPLGYTVVSVGEAKAVANAFDAHNPDLIILDLKLPDGDGFEICRHIRSTSSVPIIILSAFGQSADKARGLGLGADDYITKPYDPIELAARIEAVLRRARGETLQYRTLFHCGPLAIDFEQHLVTLHGQEVRLSRIEYRLLEYLALNAGRTLVSDALLSKVWGPEYMGDYASLHLYICRVRRKLREDSRHPHLILTKSGIGYMMPTEVFEDNTLHE